ncbi:MAG: MnhB domain-containing protein [Opitutales bacterium]
MSGAGKIISTTLGAALCAALGVFLLTAVTNLPMEAAGLTQAVAEKMPESGVKHPVTAVLLNFRGYDTWLELGVLLLAVFGVLLAQPVDSLRHGRVLPRSDALVTRAVALILPLAVLGCGYLLWVGKYAAGGAFQAGVLLGSALVLTWLAGAPRLVLLPAWLFRVTLVLGFSAFLGVATVLAVIGEGLLAYPVPHAGNLILLIEACATLSIAWTMAALIFGQSTHSNASVPA